MGQGKGLEAGKRGGRSGEAGTEAKGAPAGPRGGRHLDPSFWTFFSSSALAEVHCAFHMKNR